MLYAQNQQLNVSGIILNMDGKPVKNIRLLIQDGRISAKSNKKGEFVLKKVRPTDSIEVRVDNKKYAHFLIGDNKSIALKISDEVLYVALDDKEEIEIPFRVLPDDKNRSGVITAEMISRSGFTSLQDIIKRFMPAIQFRVGPRGTEAIIRGINSINLSSGALVIVDGSEMTFDSANAFLNVYDIGTIEVNKTGAGYGVRGANGVIIIQTKK